MKQSSTAGTARGRKAKTGNSNASASGQNRAGSRRQGDNDRRQNDSGRGQGNSERDTRKGNLATSGATRQNTASSGKKSSAPGSSSAQGESHLEKFFLAQLKDIYYAEQKIAQSLPKMQEAATTDQLKEAFEDHLHQTQRHVKRLEKVFQTLGKEPEGEKCEAIEGIAREVDNIIEETEEGTLTRDAALIIAAQKVEHYEIATYGGLLQLAITMELHDAADLLDKTLIEEEDTDALLTEIAENEVNLGAEHEDNQYSWHQSSSQQEKSGTEEEDTESDDEDNASAQ